MIEEIRENLVNLFGYSSISVGVITEAGKSAGFFGDVTVIQAISAIGVISLVLDRTVNSLSNDYDSAVTKGLVIFAWSCVWLMLAMTMIRLI